MASVFFMNKENVTLPPGKKVVRAEEYASLIEADRILSEAKAKASKIVSDALALYDAKKEQGYADGIEEGRQEHAEKIMETAMASIDYLDTMEKEMAGLVLKAMEKIIGEMDDDELIFKVVRSGISVARNERKVLLKVSSHDLKAVEARVDELLSVHAGIGLLDVVADPRMKQGDCIIESELGIVDASLDTQINAIKKAIYKRM